MNYESINRIFLDGSERERCIRYWNFMTTSDMEDIYNHQITKQRESSNFILYILYCT